MTDDRVKTGIAVGLTQSVSWGPGTAMRCGRCRFPGPCPGSVRCGSFSRWCPDGDCPLWNGRILVEMVHIAATTDRSAECRASLRRSREPQVPLRATLYEPVVASIGDGKDAPAVGLCSCARWVWWAP